MAGLKVRKASNTSAIKSVDAVLFELERLNDRLTGTRFERLIAFNNAYYVVTSVIKNASTEHYFNSPQSIESFTVCFASYYFNAVNDIFDNKNVVPAWARIVEPVTRGRRPNFVSLLMGANAHINYDLPLALQKSINENQKHSLVKDLARMDRLIMKSGPEILDTFNESEKLASFIKRNCQLIYLKPIMYMVFYWRIIAWRNYESLESGHLDTVKLAKRSTKIANRLVWLGERLG